MRCADPVQEIVNGVVGEPVVDLAADPRRGDPALLAQDSQRLGHRVLRPPQSLSQLSDTDARHSVQGQQDFESMGIRQQIETLGPPADVHIGERCGDSVHRFARGGHTVQLSPASGRKVWCRHANGEGEELLTSAIAVGSPR